MKFNRLMVYTLPTLILSTALVACGSGVKLDNAPVEDRSTSSSSTNPGGAGTGVAPVQIGATDSTGQGPVNTAKIIYFDFDSYVLKPEFQNTVEAHAKYLSVNRAQKVAVEGHTDQSGGREYNLALGQKRAEAVRRAMTLLGVPDAQVEAVSFGKEKPATSGSDDDAQAQNRRAEINYR